MKSFRGFRRLFETLLLLPTTVVLLSGCMLMSHHGQESNLKTNRSSSAVEGQVTEASEPAPVETTPADQSRQHGDETLPMMHGAGLWKWLAGGAMVVMMAIMVL